MPDELDRGAEVGERLDAEDPDVLDGAEALVGVLVEQRVEHGAGLVAVLGEHVALRTFSARSRRVSGGRSKATWQIRSKGSRSLPDLRPERLEQHALLEQLVDDGLLALGRRPAPEEVVEGGELAPAPCGGCSPCSDSVMSLPSGRSTGRARRSP